MHHRTRFIASLFALSSGALVVGCEERSGQPDPIASISADFSSALRSRPVVREGTAAPDDSSKVLRKLGGQAKNADAPGSDLLANRIFMSAGTFDFDEAMRLESKASRLRTVARKLASNASLLADAASNAENLDISAANRMIEQWRTDARTELTDAEQKLSEVEDKIDLARNQRETHLAQAAEFEAIAVERAEEGIDLGPREGEDAINESIYFRQQADELRIKAARDDTTILTLEPTRSLAGVERDGQQAKADHARESRRTSENRVQEARAFAAQIREELDRISQTVGNMMDESVELETTEIIPRLTAAIGDFDAAAGTARGLSRGGTRAETDNAWRSVANAQFAGGRCHWEQGSILDRRADTLRQIAAGGALLDPAAIRQDIESAGTGRDEAFAAAEAAFKQSLESIGKIADNGADTARLRQSVESAIASLKGAPPASTPPSNGSRAATSNRGNAAGGGASRPSSGGATTGGFGTPAEAAKFLSDPANQMNSASLERMKSAMKADTPQGKAAEKLLTASSVMMPLFEAMIQKFGKDAVMSSLNSAALQIPSQTYKVEGVEGDVATLKSTDGSQTLKLVKTSKGWVYDLDKSIQDDPQAAMMLEFMGPMLEQMMKPLGEAVSSLSAQVKAGDYASPAEVMKALDDAMPAMGGGGGGFGR
ncbi:MAG: hypothetical protein GY895_08315 [Phycisphaera sp.]|nr:hypothetical protein [Phycisphaera sp.]